MGTLGTNQIIRQGYPKSVTMTLPFTAFELRSLLNGRDSVRFWNHKVQAFGIEGKEGKKVCKTRTALERNTKSGREQEKQEEAKFIAVSGIVN